MKAGAFELQDPVPELHNTRAIALLRPWVNVGRVGSLVLKALEKALDAKDLGKLARPGTFYDFTRYRPRTRISDDRRLLVIPNSEVRYAHDDATDRDYMFLHLREPHAFGEDYADAVVELMRQFDVTEYCRIGGMYDSVPHTRPLLVTGTLSELQLERAKDLVSPRASTYEGPTSIVNLVTDSLSGADVSTSSLMVHMPQYVQLDEDYMGASRLMQVLCAVYGFSDSLADSDRGERQYEDISRAVANNPQVREVIEPLETFYDKAQSSGKEDVEISLPPNVERFLREASSRLDDNEASDQA